MYQNKIRLCAVLLLLCMMLTLLPAKPAVAAGAYSYVRVKLSAGNVTSMSIGISGAYFIEENGVEFNGGTLSVSASGGMMTVYHSTLGMLYSGARCTLKRMNMDRSAGFFLLNGRKYLGHFNLRLASSGVIQVVNELPMAHYLYGVVGYEMSELTFGLEALKAQAIAAKCYVINQLGSYSEYDIGDTSADQVYKGYNATYTKVINAVDSTLNMLLYSGSTVVCTYFSASNGGETNLPTYAWPTKNRNNLGYAIMQDPADLANAYSQKEVVRIPINMNGSITSPLYKLILSKASASLGINAVGIDNISSVALSGEANAGTTRNLTQCAMSVSVQDASGALYQTAFSFRLSEFYTADVVSNGTLRVYWGEQIGNEYCIYHLRYGHGVGLSQRGAQQRANEGQGYEQILAFYYPQASLGYTDAIQPPENPVNLLAGTTVIQPGAVLPTATPVPGIVNPDSSVLAYGMINCDDTNYRSGPSTSYPSYGKLNTGVSLEVLGESGAWYQVRVGGQSAYVYKPYVDITGTPASSPAPILPTTMPVLPTPAPLPTTQPLVPPTAQPTAQNTPIAIGTLTTSRVNFRSAPNTASRSLGKFDKGDVVQIYNQQGKWYYVSIQGAYGYVSAHYVRTQSTASPAVASAPTESGATTARVNLREGASTASKKLTTLAKGTALSVLQRENGWYKVSTGGRSGYVDARYVKLNSTTSAATAEPVPTPSVQTTLGETVRQAFFRSSPSSSGKKLATLPKGTKLVLYELEKGWFEAIYNMKRGYIDAQYVKVGAPLNTAVPLDYTASTTVLPSASPSASENLSSSRITPPTGLTNDEVNFRTLPDVKMGAIIETLPERAYVQLLARSGTWYYAFYNNHTGYISDEYIAMNAAGSFALCEVPAGTRARSAKVKSEVNMRLGPATSYGLIRKLQKNAALTVLYESGGWALVLQSGEYGFVSTDYIR